MAKHEKDKEPAADAGKKADAKERTGFLIRTRENPYFKGSRAGINFTNGFGQTFDRSSADYCRSLGYEVIECDDPAEELRKVLRKEGAVS